MERNRKENSGDKELNDSPKQQEMSLEARGLWDYQGAAEPTHQEHALDSEDLEPVTPPEFSAEGRGSWDYQDYHDAGEWQTRGYSMEARGSWDYQAMGCWHLPSRVSLDLQAVIEPEEEYDEDDVLHPPEEVPGLKENSTEAEASWDYQDYQDSLLSWESQNQVEYIQVFEETRQQASPETTKGENALDSGNEKRILESPVPVCGESFREPRDAQGPGRQEYTPEDCGLWDYQGSQEPVFEPRVDSAEGERTLDSAERRESEGTMRPRKHESSIEDHGLWDYQGSQEPVFEPNLDSAEGVQKTGDPLQSRRQENSDTRSLWDHQEPGKEHRQDSAKGEHTLGETEPKEFQNFWDPLEPGNQETLESLRNPRDTLQNPGDTLVVVDVPHDSPAKSDDGPPAALGMAAAAKFSGSPSAGKKYTAVILTRIPT